MRKNIIITSLCAMVTFCLFTNCSSDVINNSTSEASKNTGSSIVKSRTYDSMADKYHVSKDDAIRFFESLHPGEIFDVKSLDSKEDTLLYLFNFKKGWIIVAGDRRVNPVVAESESGEISLDSPNENLVMWISTYADEIRVFKEMAEDVENEYTKLWSKISANKTITKPKTRSESNCKWAVVAYTYCDTVTISEQIPHLLVTKWGQTYPWNTSLPVDVNAGNAHCALGCVAVALGQIMYYMHYFLGKPTGLYHDISISTTPVSGPTQNIGFTRANYVANSTRWDDMPTISNHSTGNTDYAVDLMLDIGNRIGMEYSGTGSSANPSTSIASYYNLSFTHSEYNYQTVKSDLLNSKPVQVNAECIKSGTNQLVGHSWVIDGLATKTYRFVTEKHFEYTENWMYESEYYDTFDELRMRYHINSEYDVVREYAYSSTEFWLMNWGHFGTWDNGYYSVYPSTPWVIDESYNYNKTINYDFR